MTGLDKKTEERPDASANMRVEKKLEIWKKKLLDLGMRNRLLNFRDSRRGSLTITAPDYKELFHKLAVEEKTLTLPYYKIAEEEVLPSVDGETGTSEAAPSADEKAGTSEAAPSADGEAVPSEAADKKNASKKRIRVETIEGDIATDRDGREAHLTAKNLKDKAKTIQEEQGVNVLYLAFGFLDWKDTVQGKDQIQSPLLLVPVSLKQGILTSPYKLSLHEDEILLNPTLAYKLEIDYKLTLPEFDLQKDDVEGYLNEISKMVASQGWTVIPRCSIALLSFSKINMYKDLTEHGSRMLMHPLIRGLCQEASSDAMNQVDLTEVEGFRHDSLKAESSFQVVDADSSQQDAILMSQKGASFVLQGPPGTGKSQTITNMIAQALGEGKKVLFVSEKMAALEVVYNRLSSAGLADFCLVLHSNKANKREFLDSLRKVTELKPISVKESALYKLKELEDRRSRLNAYCEQLHETIEPMKQSVFDANGMIASLADMPDLIFSLEKIELNSLDQDRLYQLRLLVDELSKRKLKLTEDYEENTWRGSRIGQINHEIRHDLSALFADCRETLMHYQQEQSAQETATGLKLDPSLDQMKGWADLLEYGSNPPADQRYLHYLTLSEEELNNRRQQAATLESIWKEALSLKQELSARYQNGIFDLKARKLLEETLPAGSRYQEASLVGEEELEAFLTLYSSDIRADAFWFSPQWNDAAMRKQWFDTGVTQVIKVARARDLVLSDYEKDILSIDYKGMLTRFKTEYTSFFRFLNGQYKQDCNTIRGLKKAAVKKLSNDEILTLLNQLKDYHEALEELMHNDSKFRQYLGGWYQGEWTRFDAITDAMDHFRRLQAFYGGQFPEAVKEDLLTGQNTSRYEKDLLYLRSRKEDKNAVGQQSSAQNTSGVRNAEKTSSNQIPDREGELKKACVLVMNWEESLKAVKEQSLDQEVCLAALYQGLLKLAALEDCQEILAGFRPRLETFFGVLYQSADTNWNLIQELLSWNLNWARASKELLPEETAREELCQDAQRAMSRPDWQKNWQLAAAWLRNYHARNEETLKTFCDLYEEEVGLPGLPLSGLSDKVNRCQNHLEGLEDWLDFDQILQDCEEAGLGDFTRTALQARIPSDQLSGVFLKRIQRLWLDMVTPKLPAIQSFRTRSHQELIDEFTRLDQEQMKLAQARIRERLIKKLPNMNSFTSARDEVGILNHEMGKQRKIMPVRKLFNSIPNLLPRLKPCMMMSPLSVSQFLESEAYQFDLVIFDEASQVKTENAIGAISRGRQAIIAGDMHQLPPTNFFNSSLSADDYDEENEDDSEAFESVLDESGTVMPQLTLKWHYRSKNESLITFSNRMIYNNSLVTFPSPSSSHELEGVEYIYVPEGIYQRSSSRSNPIEAGRLAEEVFRLIALQPNRSMGVITFSEAQQRCVEEAIIARRLEHPESEWYFSEGREEPFFIKNLENVQGDERDIILFSIGYGKASPTEELHMNFGPLNQAGGYRRLNVAITRAKYTIKLIGSILPTDMRITEDSPRGVRMLRDYIAFAQNGVEALEEGQAHMEHVHAEAGFEDSIAAFLESSGYALARQIGCSGYRIDMAVKDPEEPSRYVLGIECDGVSYHSSRTARERDRLRRSVLTAMGWKLCRVWSTDWVKDPVTEGAHLLAAIEEALKEKDAETEAAAQTALEEMHEQLTDDKVNEQIAIESSDEPLTGIEEKSYEQEMEQKALELDDMITELEDPAQRALPQDAVADSQFGFAGFEPVTFARQTGDYPQSAIADAMDTILEKQAPVHLYLLCRQLAPLMGSSKVTQKVKNQVLTIIKSYQNSHGWELRGDFLWQAGQTQAIPRVPVGEDGERELKYIAVEELAEAMRIILEQSIGLPREELFHILTREYGYARTTASMSEYLEAAFQYLNSNDNRQ